jgi:hypothetical protein
MIAEFLITRLIILNNITLRSGTVSVHTQNISQKQNLDKVFRFRQLLNYFFL